MLDKKTSNSAVGVHPSFLHEQHSCMREMGKEHRYACHHARMRSRWKWFQHKGKQVQRALEREAYRSTQSLASPPAGETCASQKCQRCTSAFAYTRAVTLVSRVTSVSMCVCLFHMDQVGRAKASACVPERKSASKQASERERDAGESCVTKDPRSRDVLSYLAQCGSNQR